MWKRKCPLCFVRIPWTEAVAHSYEFSCPACHASLELSRFTRIFGGFGGITGALMVLYLGQRILHGWFWAMPVVAAILGFGLASALSVLVAGDFALRARPTATTFPHPKK